MTEEPLEVEGTGHPAVDEVLRSLERLDERPVDEHVPVFEAAHDTLRRALADGGAEAAPGTDAEAGAKASLEDSPERE